MKHLATFILVFFALNTFASSAEKPADTIIYKGKKHYYKNQPLKEFFLKNPGKLPKGYLPKAKGGSGYVATFDIINGQMVLKNLEVLVKDTLIHKGMGTKKDSIPGVKMLWTNTKWKSVMSEVFPDHELKIDWYSAIAVIPHGAKIGVDANRIVMYEGYYVLEIDKGILKREKDFTHEAFENFKDKQFNAFKKTSKYTSLLKNLSEQFKDKGPAEAAVRAENTIRKYITNYTSTFLIN